MGLLDGKVAIVTGAGNGVGRGEAIELADQGAKVVVNDLGVSVTGEGADKRTADEVVDVIKGRGGEAVANYDDVADFNGAKSIIDTAVEAFGKLDVLVNNAGIGGGGRHGRRETSADGHELRFAVNYLAPFLLTHLLLPLLRRSAPARIVNVASVGQAPIDFDDVMLQRGYDGFTAYRQSKLAQIMFTFELAERLRAAGETGVTVNALHPASLMPTKMVRESFGYTMSTIADGLEATRRLVIAPELDGVSGRYFDRLEEGRAEPQAYDPAARRRLWQLSEELVAAEAAARPER